MTGTNRERVIDAISLQFDELFTTMLAVKKSHFLSDARGDNLDDIGKILSTDRAYLETDSAYRARLLEVVSINSSAGTKSVIKTYLATYLAIDEGLISVEESVSNLNTIYIRLQDTYTARKAEIRTELLNVTAAGVFTRFIFDNNNWGEAEWDSEDYTWSSE